MAQFRRPKALGQRQSICANPGAKAAGSNRIAKNNVRVPHPDGFLAYRRASGGFDLDHCFVRGLADGKVKEA